MVDINTKDRTLRVKLVYYGPALSGKTTNLKVLHERALQTRRGELVSVDSMQDRTILCDLLPLRSGGFRGFDLRLQLLAVPGQAMYAATRKVVLKAADGVVFVANSALDRLRETLQSLQEMNANLIAQQLDPHTIPLVVQFNKRDLPRTVDLEALERQLNARRVPSFPAVATRGAGVLETFAAVLTATMRDLSRRYRTMDLPPGQSVEDWTAATVRAMFDRDRLDTAVDAGAPVPDAVAEEELQEIELSDGTLVDLGSGHRLVKVNTPTDKGASPPTGERLVDPILASYAEASTELGFAASELREERELARRRLEEMRQALQLTAGADGAGDVERRVRCVLEMLLRAGSATTAAFRVNLGGTAQVLCLPPLASDPLSGTRWGGDHLEAQGELGDPLLEQAVDSPDLTDALRAGEPSFEAVALVPLRSPERWLGLALLYYDRNAALPSRDTLVHLGFLACELAGLLEAQAAREASLAAERLRTLSLASAAALASLVARLPPESVRRHRLALRDVLAPLEKTGVVAELAQGADGVLGDPPLIRFALASLAHLCEADALARGESARTVIAAESEGDSVCVSVSSGGPIGVLAPPRTDPGVAEAELTVVQAVVDLHGGALAQVQDGDGRRRFTMRLPAA
ncbi:MAG TPA: GTPase domain-containing protein [Vicinamibacteria bacterium]|nr:GTPase domain-containing protein [Vicinamibacteria bacterium]